MKQRLGKVKGIKEELADILIYSLGLANVLDIDLTQAVAAKIEQDERKYPAGA